MPLYTAQYRYSGRDRLDITVKGNCPAGKLYAPTWEMVMNYKKDSNKLVYTNKYYSLLTERWQQDYFDIRESTARLVNIIAGNPATNMPPRDVTLVCFCPAEAFCHRYLLKEWLVHNWPQIQYGGERHV